MGPLFRGSDRRHRLVKAPLPQALRFEIASVPEMLEMVACHGVLLSSQHHQGCRVVQRLLEETDNRGCQVIFARLRGHLWELVRCGNGNHVLQQCINRMSGDTAQLVVEELMSCLGDAKRLAMHRYGCRVFQRLLEHTLPSQQERLLDDALVNGKVLCTHTYANYVVQHILEHCRSVPAQRDRLVAAIVNQAAHLCCSREGAAVVSKVFSCGTLAEQQAVAVSLLRSDGKWQNSRYVRRENIVDVLERFHSQPQPCP